MKDATTIENLAVISHHDEAELELDDPYSTSDSMTKTLTHSAMWAMAGLQQLCLLFQGYNI